MLQEILRTILRPNQFSSDLSLFFHFFVSTSTQDHDEQKLLLFKFDSMWWSASSHAQSVRSASCSR